MNIDAMRIKAEARERGWMTAAELRDLREYGSRPAPAEDVPAQLKFMLEPEAMAEAAAFRKATHGLCWSAMRDPTEFAEKHLIGVMAERWPYVARADAAVGGVVVKAIRKIAREWRSMGHFDVGGGTLASGHPQDLEENCLAVIRYGWTTHPDYAEDAPDRLLVKASDEACDRDAPEFEGET